MDTPSKSIEVAPQDKPARRCTPATVVTVADQRLQRRNPLPADTSIRISESTTWSTSLFAGASTIGSL